MRRQHPLALGAFVTLLCAVTWAIADPSYPQWWLDYDVVAAQPPSSSNTTAYNAWMQANYAPVTLGQLKYVATQAQAYLNSKLAGVGGAGPAIGNVVANFTLSDSGNYAVADLGQLKNVALPFYQRLQAVGFNTERDLNYRLSGNANSTVWASSYPWNTSTNTSVNYGVADLGQLKFVFAFDLDAGSAGNFTVSENLDTTGDGFRDAWAFYTFGNLDVLTTTSGNTTGDDVPYYEDANASIHTAGILTVSITYPSNGSSL